MSRTTLISISAFTAVALTSVLFFFLQEKKEPPCGHQFEADSNRIAEELVTLEVLSSGIKGKTLPVGAPPAEAKRYLGTLEDVVGRAKTIRTLALDFRDKHKGVICSTTAVEASLSAPVPVHINAETRMSTVLKQINTLIESYEPLIKEAKSGQ